MRRIRGEHGAVRRAEHGSLLDDLLLADPRLGLPDDPLLELLLRGRRRDDHGRNPVQPRGREEVPDPAGARVDLGGRRLRRDRVERDLRHDERDERPRRGVRRCDPPDGLPGLARADPRDQPRSQRNDGRLSALFDRPAGGHGGAGSALRSGNRRQRDEVPGLEGHHLDLHRRAAGLDGVVPLLRLRGDRDGLDAPGPFARLQEPTPPHGRDGVRGRAEEHPGSGQRAGRDRRADQDRA
mmetsp:Transcript_15157/g.35127  ORF Transcript_15157/g.35127 Transcript_15157/m.35127 type:complete len:239 (-) Transcript_15157:1124-1840(-)